MPAYDAFLLLSFGGPEGTDDVLPFLENVTRGRGVPKERLAEVAEHYYAFGGVSPINAQCRDLLKAIGAAFAASGIDLPLYWGNRNWHPFIEDTVRQLKADGVERALAFVTSAYSSYSACRQYLDDLDRAVAAAGPGAPRIDKIRPYFNHPGFIEPFAANTGAALATLPGPAQAGARLVFTAHSIPVAMAAASGSPSIATAVPAAAGGRYAAELREAARLIAERASSFHPALRPEGPPDEADGIKRARSGGALPFDLVFQSRSGPPSVPWLEPDINDHLAALAKGTLTSGEPLKEGPPSAVVVVPVGFVSDHMEVVHDLDVEAAHTAASLGLPFARAKAPGPAPRFAAMVAELVAERLSGTGLTGTGLSGTEPKTLGDFGPRVYQGSDFAGGAESCPPDCCRYTPRRPGRPA